MSAMWWEVIVSGPQDPDSSSSSSCDCDEYDEGVDCMQAALDSANAYLSAANQRVGIAQAAADAAAQEVTRAKEELDKKRQELGAAKNDLDDKREAVDEAYNVLYGKYHDKEMADNRFRDALRNQEHLMDKVKGALEALEPSAIASQSAARDCVDAQYRLRIAEEEGGVSQEERVRLRADYVAKAKACDATLDALQEKAKAARGLQTELQAADREVEAARNEMVAANDAYNTANQTYSARQSATQRAASTYEAKQDAVLEAIDDRDCMADDYDSQDGKLSAAKVAAADEQGGVNQAAKDLRKAKKERDACYGSPICWPGADPEPEEPCDCDSYEQQIADAQSRYDSLREQYDEARKERDKLHEDVTRARDALSQAQRQLADAKKAMDDAQAAKDKLFADADAAWRKMLWAGLDVIGNVAGIGSLSWVALRTRFGKEIVKVVSKVLLVSTSIGSLAVWCLINLPKIISSIGKFYEAYNDYQNTKKQLDAADRLFTRQFDAHDVAYRAWKQALTELPDAQNDIDAADRSAEDLRTQMESARKDLQAVQEEAAKCKADCKK